MLLAGRTEASGNVYPTIVDSIPEPFFPFSSITQRLLCWDMKFGELVNRCGKIKKLR